MSDPQATSELIRSKKIDLHRIVDRNQERKGSRSSSTVTKFINYWVDVAKVTGLDEELIDLLYEGFKIAQGEPFHRYVRESQDANAYSKLFSAGRTQENSGGEAVALGLNLLALEINSPSMETSLGIIAEKLPRVAAKTSKQSETTIKHKLESLLLAPLAEMDLSSTARIEDGRNLYLLLKSPLEAFASDLDKKVRSVRKTKALMTWLAIVAGEVPPAADPSSFEAVDLGSSAGTEELDMGAVIGFLASHQHEYDNMKESCSQLAQELEDVRLEADEKSAELAECTSQLDTAKMRIHELEDELATSHDQLKSNESQLVTLKHDLDEAQLMLDTTAERDAHKEDAATKRMAQKLSREYRDFLDALEQPMDVELGEMLRDMLIAVFDILKSSGIDL